MLLWIWICLGLYRIWTLFWSRYLILYPTILNFQYFGSDLDLDVVLALPQCISKEQINPFGFVLFSFCVQIK